MIELIHEPANPAWPPRSPDKRERKVGVVVQNGATRAESLSEIAAAEKITFDQLIELNFGVRKGNPSGDRWARIINWYLKSKLNGTRMADGNFKFKGGETIYVPKAAAKPDTSPQAQAKKDVDAFAVRAGVGKFVHIRRDDLVADLKARIDNPALINQSDVGLCPSASVLYALATRDVLAYARLVMDLYEHGRGQFGKWLLEPCQDLLNLSLGSNKIRPVDWIPMASIRDSGGWLSGEHDEHEVDDFDGAFIPRISGWMRRAGYSTVIDGFRLVGNASPINLERANELYKTDHQVIMLITAAILREEVVPRGWTNHAVVLASPIQFGADADGDRTVSFSVYTWGNVQQVPRTGVMKMRDFLLSYFGFIAGKY